MLAHTHAFLSVCCLVPAGDDHHVFMKVRARPFSSLPGMALGSFIMVSRSSHAAKRDKRSQATHAPSPTHSHTLSPPILPTQGCFVKIFYQRWGWDLCLIVGVITSATDPVAVVALLRELGAKVSLSTTIEGESLLNDGSAVVIFSVLMEIAKGVYGVNDIGIMIGTFVRMAIGGVIIGYLFGEAALIWISHVFNDALVEICVRA